MTSSQGFRPNWTSVPGDTIVDILEEQNLSTIEFARRIGYTLEKANDILQGRATITIAVARQLERVLGASVEFWMSRDFQYREDIVRLHMDQDEWLKELPLEDMIRFGWLTPMLHSSDVLASCLHFFNVSSIQAWHKAYAGVLEMVAFRTSPSFDSRPAAVTAWLRQGEVEGNAIRCDPWDPELFEKSLSDIKSLTRKKNPNLFIPELQKYCATSGVAVVVVRAPTGCRASGATRFLSQDKALLLLSFRYLTDDHFWFTFFHEAGHLLLHGKKRLFLEEADIVSTNEEKEANEFAALTLIPSEFLPSLMNLPVDSREIIRFATRLGISPGLVVGQLQHYRRIKHNQLNRLKRRFRWEE
jgi:HTH-type transcriptional regulator/antitoxin HigA